MPTRSLRSCSRAVVALTLALSVFVTSSIQAENVEYAYDALGRLVRVTRSDGTQTVYSLDAAGNRTEVKEGAPPSAPASIVVPSSSATGAYVISWSAPAGTLDRYELYESVTSSFSSQVLVHNGAATSRSIVGKTNGTYYYRVRACGVSCGDYRHGANGVVVTLLPGIPASITVPTVTNIFGSYQISWGTASPPLTRYELWEARSADFSGATRIVDANVTSTSVNRANGSYFYRVRACNGGDCGEYRTAAGPVIVSIPPPPPPPPTGLSAYQNSMCSWAASWNPSPGATGYQIRDMTGAIQKPVSGTSTTYSFCGVIGYNGDPRKYRPRWVKACDNNGCGAEANFP